MAAWLVVVAVLIACAVIQVREVCIVCHALVTLQHRVFRLLNVQFRIVLSICGKGLIINVTGQTVCTHQSAGIHVTAFLVHTARLHQRGQQTAVAFHVDARHTQVLHVSAPCVQRLPVHTRTIVNHKPVDVACALQRQTAGRQFAQVAQFQCLQRCRERYARQRSTLCEVHAGQGSLACLQCLQLRVVAQVYACEVA